MRDRSRPRAFAPFQSILRILDSRNYRLFFFGQLISLIGLWMTNTASMWLVYHLSKSPLLLGLAGFCSNAPTFLLGSFAGVWVDRLNRHRLILVTQSLSMLQSFALAFFALTNTISIEHIIVLNIFQGMINAFDMPARQALMAGLVEKKENLGNAIALNSSMFNLGRLIGPGIGGFLIAWQGVGICFLIDGFTYIAVIGSLLAMTVVRVPKRPARHPWHEFKEGILYVRSHPQIRVILLLLAIISVWGIPVLVLAPIFTRDVLHGQANDLGLLLASEACGAVVGALYLSQRPHNITLIWRTIVVGGLIQSTGWLIFSQTRWLPFSMFFISTIGFGGILLLASCNTLIQILVEDSKRGRVMSLYIMAFNGMMPLGYLIEGSLVQRLGVIHTIWIKCTICFVGILCFRRLLQKMVHGGPLAQEGKVVKTSQSRMEEAVVP